MEIETDIVVDLEAGIITIGLLSDLTGVFSFLVQGVVDGYQAYVDELNDNGGINGLMIELEVFDTVYQADNTVLGFNELKDQVVAFGHSVGSPQTVGIQPDLEAEGILAIPLTWYSGWTDPTFSSNLIHHGAPYCIEAMNIFDFFVGEMGSDLTVALASLPGDKDLVSMAGAKIAAEELRGVPQEEAAVENLLTDPGADGECVEGGHGFPCPRQERCQAVGGLELRIVDASQEHGGLLVGLGLLGDLGV